MSEDNKKKSKPKWKKRLKIFFLALVILTNY